MHFFKLYVVNSKASSRASSGVNYVSHIRSYLENYSLQNITLAKYNNLWSIYFGLIFLQTMGINMT